MNTRPPLRSINGVLLLDKATGLSSNAALQRVRRLFRAKKAGHTGSLDPLASGLLPVCLGEATKLAGFLLNHDKRYRVSIRLGVTTRTGDSEGEVLATAPVPSLSRDQLMDVVNSFLGEILQCPPMHSALKHQGKRLYQLARQGIEVEREPRPVTIHELNLLDYQGDVLDLYVKCSKGTYIRTLAEDIGAVLGCGGHVIALRRTEVGDLTLAASHTETSLASLSDADLLETLLPPDTIVQPIPAVYLTEETGFDVRRGQAVLAPQSPANGWVRIYVRPDVFLGMGEVQDDGRIAPRRLLNPNEPEPTEQQIN